MFSSRFSRWNLRPNRISRAVQERRRAGREILDLTGSNPTLAGLEPEQPWTDPAPPPGIYRPDPMGLAAAREAVAAGLPGEVQVDPGRIVLTSSTSEAYAWLFKVLTDPGDTVLVPTPSYPLFDFLAGMESVQTQPYELVYEDGWRIDLPALLDDLARRPRALVVVHPNNPTGSYLRRDEREALSAACARHQVPLISDEVFLSYPLEDVDDAAGSLAGSTNCLTFCLGGLSKQAGLPQVKLGWIIVDGPPKLVNRALARLELVADTFLSVSGPVQEQVPALLRYGQRRHKMIHARVRENYRALHRIAGEEPAVTVLRAGGGWSGIVRVPETLGEEAQVLDLLRRDGVLVQPGYYFDLTGGAHLVVGLLTDPAVFKAGVRRLVRRAGLWS